MVIAVVARHSGTGSTEVRGELSPSAASACVPPGQQLPVVQQGGHRRAEEGGAGGGGDGGGAAVGKGERTSTPTVVRVLRFPRCMPLYCIRGHVHAVLLVIVTRAFPSVPAQKLVPRSPCTFVSPDRKLLPGCPCSPWKPAWCCPHVPQPPIVNPHVSSHGPRPCAPHPTPPRWWRWRPTRRAAASR